MSELEHYRAKRAVRAMNEAAAAQVAQEDLAAYKAQRRTANVYALAQEASICATANDALVISLSPDNPALELRLRRFGEAADIVAQSTILRYGNRP